MHGTELLSAAKEQENVRDRALMARSAAGERESLEELFKLYNERIYHSNLRICRNADDAVEATQEAFLTVFKRMRDHYADISSFRDYVFTSSRNASLKIIAKRRRAVPTEEIPESAETSLVDASEDPERSILIEDQQHVVQKASGRLSERQLEALKMYELDGMDYAQIGSELGLEANAIAQLISRARQRLRTEVRYSGTAQETSTEICTKAMALMPMKADGTLTKRQATWLDPHIKDCDICKTNFSMMEEVGASYRSLLLPSALIFERVFRDDALAKLFPSLSDAGPTRAIGFARGSKLFLFGKRLTAPLLILGGLLAVGVVSSGAGMQGFGAEYTNTFGEVKDERQVAYAGVTGNMGSDTTVADRGTAETPDGTTPTSASTMGGSSVSVDPTWPGLGESFTDTGDLVFAIDPTTGSGDATEGEALSGVDEGDGTAESQSTTRRRAGSSNATTETRRRRSGGSEGDSPFTGFALMNSGSEASGTSSTRRRRTSSGSRSSRSSQSSRRSGRSRSSSSGRRSGSTRSGSSTSSSPMPPSLTIPGTSSTIGSVDSGTSGSGDRTSSGDSGSGTSGETRSDSGSGDSGTRDSGTRSGSSEDSSSCGTRSCTESGSETRR